MTSDTDPIAAAAARLMTAQQTATPCEPVRDLIGREDVAAAYAVQDRIAGQARAAGRVIVGRKIGLTSKAVQAQLGVDQPDYGALFADRGFADGAQVPTALFLQPKIEAEVALCLGRDLEAGQLDLRALLAAIAWVAPALEIVDSRIARWDISLADTIADNASYGAHVIGAPVQDFAALDFPALGMEMTRNGASVSQGSGRDCMGSPLQAALWLANTLASLGVPMKAGDLILTGALGPMAPVSQGDRVAATIAPLGTVECAFG